MSREYNFWVYIVTNRNHSVLYIYYEYYRDIRDAIARETQTEKVVARKESCLDRSR